MQAYRRSISVTAHVILDRGEWSAWTPRSLCPRERTPVGEGRVAGLDVLENLLSLPGYEPLTV